MSSQVVTLVNGQNSAASRALTGLIQELESALLAVKQMEMTATQESASAAKLKERIDALQASYLKAKAEEETAKAEILSARATEKRLIVELDQLKPAIAAKEASEKSLREEISRLHSSVQDVSAELAKSKETQASIIVKNQRLYDALMNERKNAESLISRIKNEETEKQMLLSLLKGFEAKNKDEARVKADRALEIEKRIEFMNRSLRDSIEEKKKLESLNSALHSALRDEAVKNQKLLDALENAEARIRKADAEKQSLFLLLKGLEAKDKEEVQTRTIRATEIEKQIAAVNQSLRDTSEEKKKIESLNATLRAEVERLKVHYPLRDLLSIKEAEIERVRRELARLGPKTGKDEPGRAKAQEILGALVEQREQICKILKDRE